MSLKHRISSPLEAGTSILDAHHLPPHLDSALEYASRRLARKGLHITLVVVRREYQLPASLASSTSASTVPISAPNSPPLAAAFSPPATPASVPLSAASTPSRAGFASPMAAIKQLVRTGTHPTLPSLERAQACDLQRSKTVSPTSASSLSSSVTDVSGSRGPMLRWPLSPSTPGLYSSAIPRTPATPATTTTASSTTGTDISLSSQNTQGQFGLRLVHTSLLHPRTEKTLRATLDKAAKRFGISPDWLPLPLTPASCGLTADLIHHSVSQNEVLFACAGLTLLSLDHLYTFKGALASYATTRSTFRLEDAVDELRRYVLSRGGRRLRKSSLLREYTWVGLGHGGDAALSDVSRMYKRAYGGLERDAGVENDVDPLAANPAGVVRVVDEKKEAFEARIDEVIGELKLQMHEPEEDEEEEEVEAQESGDIGEIDDEDSHTPTKPQEEEEEPHQTEEQQQQEEEDQQKEEEVENNDIITPTKPPTHHYSPPPPAPTTPTAPLPPSPMKGPPLKLQTNFSIPMYKPVATRPEPKIHLSSGDMGDDDDDIVIHLDSDSDGELTARPSAVPRSLPPRWSTLLLGPTSIDQVLSPVGAGENITTGNNNNNNNSNNNNSNNNNNNNAQDGPLGPMTPNGYDDISPVTRGEWGFLMVGDGWKARTVAVETC